MRKKLSHDEFAERIPNTIVPLESYINGRQRIKVQCQICGHVWTPYARKLLEGSNCPKCNVQSKTKTNDKFVEQLLEINTNIEPLEIYQNSHTKIMCHCKICGYKWMITPSKLLSGKGCPNCAGNRKRTIEEIEDILHIKNITLLSTEYCGIHSKITVKCNTCGYIWNTEPNVLINHNCGCPNCYGNIKKTHEEFLKELSCINNDYKILSNYDGANNPIECECLKCGYIFTTTPSNLLRGHGCKNCNHSLAEKTAKNILDNCCIKYVPQKSFDDLLGVSNSRKLSYDFYLPDYNILIEIQGQQHYHPVDFGSHGKINSENAFKKQQIHDQLKRDYAIKNNIKLIEIPYWEFNNIEFYLKSRLHEQSA